MFVQAINTLFNKAELDRLQQFLKEDDGEDTWFGFLLSVDSKGAPFWSLQNVRKIKLNGKVYIVGISTQARNRRDLLSEIAYSANAEAAGQVNVLRSFISAADKNQPLTDLLNSAIQRFFEDMIYILL